MLKGRELLKSEDSVVELAGKLLSHNIPNVVQALKRNNLSFKKLIGTASLDYEWIEKTFRENVEFKKAGEKDLPSQLTWYVKALAEGVGPFSLVSSFLLSDEYNLTKRDWKINNFMDIYREQKFAWMTQYRDIHEYIRQVDFYFPAVRFWYLDLDEKTSAKLAKLDYLVPDHVTSKLPESVPEASSKCELDGDGEDEDEDEDEDDDGERVGVAQAQSVVTGAANVKLVRNQEVQDVVEKARRKELRSVFVMSLDCYILDMVYSNVFSRVKSLFDCKITKSGSGVKYQFGDGGHPSMSGLTGGERQLRMSSFFAELERVRGHILQDAQHMDIIGGNGVLYSTGDNPLFFSAINGKSKAPKEGGCGKLIIQNSAAAADITMSNFKSHLTQKPDAEAGLNSAIAALTEKYVRKCMSKSMVC